MQDGSGRQVTNGPVPTLVTDGVTHLHGSSLARYQIPPLGPPPGKRDLTGH
jgi:hypothetical protein